MNTNRHIEYTTPQVEVVMVAVESGYNSSSSQLPEYDEDGDVIVIG